MGCHAHGIGDAGRTTHHDQPVPCNEALVSGEYLAGLANASGSGEPNKCSESDLANSRSTGLLVNLGQRSCPLRHERLQRNQVAKVSELLKQMFSPHNWVPLMGTNMTVHTLIESQLLFSTEFLGFHAHFYVFGITD